MKDVALYFCPLCVTSPSIFLESLGTIMVEVTKLSAIRLTEVSGKIKYIVMEFVFD